MGRHGSPAYVDMAPFKAAEGGWEAQLMVSRSAMQSLANYLKLTEWYEDDLGVLELQ